MADQVKGVTDKVEGAKDQASETADKATGTLKEQAVGAFAGAARDILGPAIQQMSKQAAEQAATYAREQGPKLVKEQVLPQVMKATGADNPGDLAKQGIGKAGEMISGAGGITGVAGKIMGKLGGKGGKKGVATGYGQGRRIMVQQVQYVPVNIKDVYRAWTTSEWPEYMHRVNTLDRQIEEEDVRYSIGVKGLWFQKSFTAQVQEQVPFKFIVWNTTQGNIKNTGRVSFHEEGDDLTLMILNLDMAPSGLREKWVRGFRYHKRGIRSDFHRFAAWVQMRTQEQLDDMEGWLGTIEGGKITQTHEEYVEEHEEEQDRGGEKPEGEGEEDEGPVGQAEEEELEGEEPEAAQLDQDEEFEEEEEPEEEEEEEEPQAEEEPEEEPEEEEPEAEEEPEDEEPEEEPEEEEPEPKPRARRRKPKPPARRRRPTRAST
jgi:uncharacterized membrane protein